MLNQVLYKCNWLQGCAPSLESSKQTCRPFLLGWRPSLLGWRPSLVGWRPCCIKFICAEFGVRAAPLRLFPASHKQRNTTLPRVGDCLEDFQEHGQTCRTPVPLAHSCWELSRKSPQVANKRTSTVLWQCFFHLLSQGTCEGKSIFI